MAGSRVSARVYHQHVKGNLSNKQNDLVLNYIREVNQPQCIRMMQRILNARGFTIDLVSLRRSVTNLSKPNPKGRWENQWHRQMLRIAYTKECPITGKVVGWYEAEPIQLNLFQSSPAEA
jgi:hypothetical protein